MNPQFDLVPEKKARKEVFQLKYFFSKWGNFKINRKCQKGQKGEIIYRINNYSI
jgi:hypothetical protein